MKRNALLIVIVVTVFVLAGSCSKPGQYPPPVRVQAMNSMESFRTYFLEGRFCDAEIVFNQAVDLYAKIDNMCFIADAHIQKYLLLSYVNSEKEVILEMAEQFALMGNCRSEERTIHDVRSGAGRGKYSTNLNSMPNDIYRSVMLRRAALDRKDRTYVEHALKIDRVHGWTLFVINDLMILASLTEDQEEKEIIQKRIDFLRGYMQECN